MQNLSGLTNEVAQMIFQTKHTVEYLILVFKNQFWKTLHIFFSLFNVELYDTKFIEQ